MAHREVAQDVFGKFSETLEDIAKVETQSRTKGRSMGIILSPK
jgi:translation initiation factor IF-3